MADERSVDLAIKIVLVGPKEVGKSRLLSRLAKDEWIERLDYHTTLGVDVGIRDVFLANARVAPRFRFWDTSGRKKFRTMTSAYFKYADVILFCFDVTRPETLAKCLEKFYVQRWLDTANRGAYVALVACKSDQRRHDADEAMMKTMEDAGLPVHWTSSRAGTGITELLQEAGEHVLRTRRKEIQEQRFVDSAYLVPKPVQQRTTCECLIL